LEKNCDKKMRIDIKKTDTYFGGDEAVTDAQIFPFKRRLSIMQTTLKIKKKATSLNQVNHSGPVASIPRLAWDI
jgi:hypothetical protein